ncbi:hypothetical protein KFE98_18405 [bacterium SCSIO 12741]|nr:hypothetical protein KFE98_18405 [bacterium SCSIO 12741]
MKWRKEQVRLNWEYRKLGYEPLENPVRHGWFKFLVLRDDIARRADATIFQEILDKCGYRIWAANKPLLHQYWEEYPMKNRNFLYPGIRKISPKTYRLLSEEAQKWFRKTVQSWSPWIGYRYQYHLLVPLYFFRPKMERAYITHRKVIDSDLDRRSDEIERLMLRPEYYDLSNYNYKSWWCHEAHQGRKERKHSKRILKNYNEWDYDRHCRS